MSDEELDNLFRRSARQYQPPFDPEAWKEMDRRLDGRTGKLTGFRRWLPVLLLLLLVGLVTVWKLADKPAAPAAQVPAAGANEIQQPTTGAGMPGNAATREVPPAPARSETPAAPALAGSSIRRSINKTTDPGYTRPALVPPLELVTPEVAQILSGSRKYKDGTTLAQTALQYTSPAAPDSALQAPQATEAGKNGQVKEKVFLKNLTLALVVAPDLTTVRFRNAEAVSINAGLLVSLPLTRRLSLVTGALNATKRYSTGADDYEPYPGFWDGRPRPEAIVAKCQVLDIPLNLQYQVLERGRHTVTIQAGVSSYLMLREKYTYTYQHPGHQPYSKDWEVSNENRHWFGVQNLSVGYTHRLSPAVAIGVEPFVKLPLSDIGAGRVKLTSAGVFFKAGYTLR